MDSLHFVKDEGDQEADGKRGKGNKKDKGQEGETPTATGQEGKGSGGETALEQEDEKSGEVIPMMQK